ncbi:MAG: hypothetical protein IPJ19_04355 [Planctomycetes bacterium]|nr:hypothetical protein [Planctomycetota bacterium]
MKSSLHKLLATGAVLAASATLAWASIQRLDLAAMMKAADNAVVGTITHKETIRIDHPVAGKELYFTALTIEGHSLKDDSNVTVDVWFGGGFVDPEHGVHNSEAPSDDDQKIGNHVVAFYHWEPNMGGDHAGNALYAWHGGLYRTFEARSGKTIVQGRGDGYAIPANIELGELTKQIKVLAPQPK